MSLSGYFRSLGAPLKNYRWSWGAVSPVGEVNLRVWTDELERYSTGLKRLRP